MSNPLFSRVEAEALLRRLVAIRSYPGEELSVQQAVADWLQAHGIAPELQATANGAPNVLARLENGAGPTLLLNGHVDTVLAARDWAVDPWVGAVDGDRFSALGAADMKSGVVVNMLVTRWLHEHRDDWRGTLIFSSVTDEEAYSHGARALIDAGIAADGCINTEPMNDKLIIGGPGKVLIRITAIGRSSHAFMPWEGINAAIELARFVAEVTTRVPAHTHPRIPTSQSILGMQSGNAQYVVTVPEHASALLTRQIVPGETVDSVIAELRSFADSLNSAARFEFTVEPPYYPSYEFDQPEHPLMVAMRDATAHVYGEARPTGYIVGISDANVTQGIGGIPTVVFGPRGGDFHQATEWLDLSSLVPVCEVVRHAALSFLNHDTDAGR
jgi:succinyl-diaminopimelate desuccinylase